MIRARECLSAAFAGYFEPGRSKEDKISAVQYVRFRFDDQALETFVSGARIELVINHRNYRAAVVLQPETQKSLAEDLTR